MNKKTIYYTISDWDSNTWQFVKQNGENYLPKYKALSSYIRISDDIHLYKSYCEVSWSDRIKTYYDFRIDGDKSFQDVFKPFLNMNPEFELVEYMSVCGSTH